jgi:hypothetical protein
VKIRTREHCVDFPRGIVRRETMFDQRVMQRGRRCIEQQIFGNPAAPVVVD